jgi:hypothetical protein
MAKTAELAEKENTRPCAGVMTKDRWEVLALLTFSHVPDSVERVRSENGQMISVFVFPPTAFQLWQDYKHGKKLPVADIRDVKRAEEIFKGFIRE